MYSIRLGEEGALETLNGHMMLMSQFGRPSCGSVEKALRRIDDIEVKAGWTTKAYESAYGTSVETNVLEREVRYDSGNLRLVVSIAKRYTNHGLRFWTSYKRAISG